MRQNMYCHACDKEFSVDMDMQADGNHIFKCPHCNHEHCRVVRGGKITSDRWDQRNGNMGLIYRPTVYSSSATDTYSGMDYGAANYFSAASWATTSTATSIW